MLFNDGNLKQRRLARFIASVSLSVALMSNFLAVGISGRA